MKFLLYALLAYIAYQFIFKLVIPVYLASRNIKKGFREMSARMNQQERQEDTSNPISTPKQKPRPKAGDYIDFEEIK